MLYQSWPFLHSLQTLIWLCALTACHDSAHTGGKTSQFWIAHWKVGKVHCRIQLNLAVFLVPLLHQSFPSIRCPKMTWLHHHLIIKNQMFPLPPHYPNILRFLSIFFHPFMFLGFISLLFQTARLRHSPHPHVQSNCSNINDNWRCVYIPWNYIT